jgi:DNA anti-recombination protein RmuC
MNVHTKPESVNMTTQEAVAKLADKYAKVEKYLRLAGQTLNSMPSHYMDIHANETIGYLEAMQRSARLKVAAGLVAQAEQAVIDAHVNDTGRAKDKDVDLPQPRSGGGGR